MFRHQKSQCYDVSMRTTVTLDADTEAKVRYRMRTEGVTFKQAINDAIRSGLGGDSSGSNFETAVVSMGLPTVNLDRALQLAGDLEDEELIRRMRSGE